MNNVDLHINKISQGIIPIAEGLAWFESGDADWKLNILRKIDLFLLQSHPTDGDVLEGIKRSGLKPTLTPCVLIQNKHLNEARQKILKLPASEWNNTFALLISILAVADEKRRATQCKNGCTHEWHNIARL